VASAYGNSAGYFFLSGAFIIAIGFSFVFLLFMEKYGC